MTQTYFLLDAAGQPAGPLTIADIDRKIASGALPADPMIVAVGGSTWSKRSELPEHSSPPPRSTAGTKRGRILRDASAGDGLIMVDGRQLAFTLEGVWHSPMAPKVDMVVEVERDASGALVAVRAVSTQQLASEQAAELADKARERAGEVARAMQTKGLPVLAALAERIGYPKLAALGALLLGWFVLPFVTVNIGMFGNSSFTFYTMLGAVNAGDFDGNGGSMSKGLLGLLAFASIGAVALPSFSRHRLAGYGFAAPLAFMGLVALVAYMKVSSAVSAISAPNALGGMFGELARDAVNESRAEIMNAISLGLGAYLAIGASLYLAWLALAHVRSASLVPERLVGEASR